MFGASSSPTFQERSNLKTMEPATCGAQAERITSSLHVGHGVTVCTPAIGRRSEPGRRGAR